MNREWMYRRSTSKGDFSPQFLNGLESFIEFACSKPAFMDGENIRCPCRKCQNRYFRDVETVRAHVKKKGFEFNYQVWVFQGESRVSDQFQHTVVGDRGDHVSTRHRNVSRNYEGQVDEQNDDPDMPSIFKHTGRPFGRVSHRYLTDKEYNAIRIYALTNCVEVDQYIDVFVDELRSSHSSLTFTDANNKINKEFAEWFAAYGVRIYVSIGHMHMDKLKNILREETVYSIVDFVVGSTSMKLKTTTSDQKIM